MKTNRKNTFTIIVLLLCVQLLASCLFVPTALAVTNYYIPNGTASITINQNSVADPGSGQCWKYVNNLYYKIWKVNFSSDLMGNSSKGLNILKFKSPNERKITAASVQQFISTAPLGSSIRIQSCPTNCSHFGDDGLSCGHKGHSLLLVSKSASGFTTLDRWGSTGRRTKTWTWSGFANDMSKYVYFKYIKAPSKAPNFTIIPVTETSMNGTFEFNKDDEVRKEPYESSTLVTSYKKGERINVVASVVNAYGNTWYKTVDGYFVFSGDVDLVGTNTTPPPATDAPGDDWPTYQSYSGYSSNYAGWYTVQKTSNCLSINDKPVASSSGGKPVFTNAKNGWYVHLIDAAAAAGTAKKWGRVNAAYDPNTGKWYEVYGFACVYYLKRNSSQNNPVASTQVCVNSCPWTIISPTATPSPTPTPSPEEPLPDVPTSISVSDGVGTYSVSGNEAIFLKPNQSSSTFVIPDTVNVNGMQINVAVIADSAFEGQQEITTVVIGKNINTIGANAFKNCTSLEIVLNGAGVIRIKNAAFSGCRLLNTFPSLDKLQSISANAFMDCVKLKKFKLGKAVKLIGKNAFKGCKSLKTINVKTKKLNKENIGSNAFKGINKKASFLCPSNKLNEYKKLFIKKGAPKTVRFK